MLNETPEQKEKRMFESYKRDLIRLHNTPPVLDSLRFPCVEYVCRCPQIDPYKMAAALVSEGIKIIFDDSAISKAENKRKENKLLRLLKEKQYKKAR